MSEKKGKKTQKKEKAKKLIHQTMLTLKEEFPALIYAINLLNKKNQWKEWEQNEDISTDGERLFYNSERIIQNFTYWGEEEIKKQILHIVLHGLLGHFDMHKTYRDEKLLWVSMDREVENMIRSLFPNNEEDWDDYDYEYEEDSLEGTMEAMDSYLGESYGISCYYQGRNSKIIRKKMLSDGAYIKRDNHELWTKYMKEQEVSSQENEENAQEKQQIPKQDPKKKQAAICERWKQAAEVVSKDTGAGGIKNIATQLKKDRMYGTGSGSLAQNIMADEKNENSYYHILMDFLTMKDTVKEQQDEIDTMLYNYGLEMYGDIPLIEPPEETEQLDINTICLAIDTSGSCSGSIARKFLRESYNIIRDVGTVSQQGELYVFLCDDSLQEERYYASIKEVELEELENMQLKGYGGTSFLPVFQRIEKIKEEEHKIDCLIYLTDGLGNYPQEKPEYPVYFLMTEEDYEYINYRRDTSFYKDWIQYIKFEK